MIPVEVKTLLEHAEYMGDGYVKVLAQDAEYLYKACVTNGVSVKTEIELPNED